MRYLLIFNFPPVIGFSMKFRSLLFEKSMQKSADQDNNNNTNTHTRSMQRNCSRIVGYFSKNELEVTSSLAQSIKLVAIVRNSFCFGGSGKTGLSASV
jgi:hypothetical protein